jgi:hypothetical protein
MRVWQGTIRSEGSPTPHLSRPGDPEAIAGPRAKVGGCAGRYHQPPRHSQSEKQTTP